MRIPRPASWGSLKQVPQTQTSEQLEEILVPDARNGVTPRQMVEAKLQILLGRIPSDVYGHFKRLSADFSPDKRDQSVPRRE
jgi:hypothetical protein